MFSLFCDTLVDLEIISATWAFAIKKIKLRSEVPPTAPKSRMNTVTLDDNGEQSRDTADSRPPTMVVARQPKQLIRTLATGPAASHTHLSVYGTGL